MICCCSHFIFCFLVDRLETFLHQKLKVPRRLVVILLYSLIVIGIYAAITIYLPIIADQTVQLFDSSLKTIKEFRGSVVGNAVLDQLQKYNVESYLKSGVKFVIDSFSSFGSFTIDLFLALLLSLFFSLEKDRLLHFSRGFKTSKIGFLYDEVAFFGSRFVQPLVK
ncbi:membrane protein [Sporolactobacillus inulinus]|uniref:Membrane protein n=1 Tax=Sporolactobacillus inulinus TaxID=2078 RepID=A0A4Y1Z7R2_9BACL|nr:membrane protein [Sporolactobacillus inulinus]